MTGKYYLHLVQHGEKKKKQQGDYWAQRQRKQERWSFFSDLQIHMSPGSCPCAKGYLGISANYCII